MEIEDRLKKNTPHALLKGVIMMEVIEPNKALRESL